MPAHLKCQYAVMYELSGEADRSAVSAVTPTHLQMGSFAMYRDWVLPLIDFPAYKSVELLVWERCTCGCQTARWRIITTTKPDFEVQFER
jgi:hypothetical protein